RPYGPLPARPIPSSSSRPESLPPPPARRPCRWAVRASQVEDRPRRNDAIGIDGRVAPVIMRADVVVEHGFRDARHPVQTRQVIPQIAVVENAPDIALEMADIDGIEPHERREQPPVRL